MKTTTRPILFNPEMVTAIQTGQKTQTRRLLKKQPVISELEPLKIARFIPDWNGVYKGYTNDCDIDIFTAGRCPLGKPGDFLWVRERWAYGSDSLPYIYYAGYPSNIPSHIENIPDKAKVRWRPSIHMPKEALRLNLEIKSNRIERLQDISEKDAIAEGVAMDVEFSAANFKEEFIYRDYTGKTAGCMDARSSFMTLWIKIYGVESWEKNPFIWVTNFAIKGT